VQQITPPSLIYDVQAEVVQSKMEIKADTLELILYFYSIEIDVALSEADAMRASLHQSTTADFSVIKLTNQTSVWLDPNFMVQQRYRIKLKEHGS
jgi:hypothetical protein